MARKYVYDGCVTPGLRERKKLATRQALGFAALRLAVERGLDDILVEDIATAAGVSPRTFNNYFASKYEAICALAVDRARRVGDALRERPADEPLWDAISAAVLEQYAGAEGGGVPDKQWTAGVRLVTGTPALLGEYLKASAVMREALAEAIAERLDVDAGRDMFPEIVAGAVTAAYEVATDHWLNADPPTALVPLVQQALRHLADGLPLPG
ncbi:MAG: hypothetical protein V7603_4339 [Micromonosporaceae bacterium]